VEEARGMRARFSSLFRLTLIKRRMFWLTEASMSCNHLSTVATDEHVDSASSPTRLQLLDGGGKLGDPGRYSPDTLGPTTLEDPGAVAASSGVTLLRTPASALCTPKSRSKLSVSLPSRGTAPTTSTLVVPYDAPPAIGILVTAPPQAAVSPG
jgi:hypothetical protein